MAAPDKVVRVGVGVLLVKRDPKTPDVAPPLVLVGRRLGSHGSGTFALPGGHLEYGETFEECGAREVLEETGIMLQPGDLQFAYATNSIIEGRHYVTIFVRGDVPWGCEAQLLEPHKCEGWAWHEWASIPQPHFLPLQALLASPFTLT